MTVIEAQNLGADHPEVRSTRQRLWDACGKALRITSYLDGILTLSVVFQFGVPDHNPTPIRR